MRVDYTGETLFDDYIADIELIDTIIYNLKKGRAAGTDHLTAEHLQFFHPTITTVLTKLFNIMLVKGIVRDYFGTSYTVPYLNVTPLEKLYPSMTLEAYPFVRLSPSFLSIASLIASVHS